MKKVKFIFSIFMAVVLMLQSSIFASNWQVQGFMSTDFSGIAETNSLYAMNTFRNLGYNNVFGNNDTWTTTGNKSTVMEYINYPGNNFGFYVNAHGNPNLFTMQNGNPSQYIYPSDISGYWHLVFIDSCSCLATDVFARAFQTVGYSNRSTLGWYEDVTVGGATEWFSYFKNVAGTTNIRSACLIAADQTSYYTPIRIFGDKTWTGIAM